MRYLLVTAEYPPFRGGVAHYYGNLVKAWPEGDSIVVLDNSQAKLIAPTGRWPWLRSFVNVWRIVKQSRADFLLIGQILPLGTVAWLLSYFTKPYAVFIHGMDWTMALGSPRKAWLTKRIINRAKTVIAANSYVAELIVKTCPQAKDKIVVINPGLASVQKPEVPEALTKELVEKYQLDGKTIILTVGRLVERKGVDKTIEALVQILPQNPEVHYVVVGDGPYLAACQELVQSLQLEQQVVFIPDADDKERAAWYQLADIFIMPSRQIGNDFEGFGIVYLEAGQAGKPVIAGRSGGVADAVADNLNGLMVNPESVTEIALALKRLIAEPKLRTELGQNGQARLVNFLWPEQARRLVQFINNLLK
ncbi:MAG TPA: glycosyltransferase family 4 protein [bacterium]|nr:glycosyltransferase family 4 protein [bacterium]